MTTTQMRSSPERPESNETPASREFGDVISEATASSAEIADRRREAAVRATAEARARRALADERSARYVTQREVSGRGGLDPVRYGDWEVKGITTDF
jgi:hypothetical protein